MLQTHLLTLSGLENITDRFLSSSGISAEECPPGAVKHAMSALYEKKKKKKKHHTLHHCCFMSKWHRSRNYIMTKSLNKQKESSVEGEVVVVAVNTWVRLPTLWFWGLRFFWRMARLPHPLTNIFRQLKAHTQIHTAALSLISARTAALLQIQLLSSSNTHSPFGSSKFNLVKWSMKMLKQSIPL